ncbi:hypothetical protein NDU88_002138 [Pleurodeles waltl]|uniref:Uncharacterized protein n=1 Tax=Pleurodeles waltl TaxID=8319 RepID=A0AAV7VYT9_PLEWA|nr:hypothetical protein NDU88_002138 [Pleurodeles waltl]
MEGWRRSTEEKRTEAEVERRDETVLIVKRRSRLRSSRAPRQETDSLRVRTLINLPWEEEKYKACLRSGLQSSRAPRQETGSLQVKTPIDLPWEEEIYKTCCRLCCRP